jgi:hypothetical protein
VPRALAPALALAAAGVALVALQLVLSARIAGPVIVADEFGYLGAARWLAGADVVPLLGPSRFYWPGYALLLAPLQALLGDPAEVYRAAQVLNALLVAAHLAPLFALARCVLGLDRGRAALAALAAGAYPAFLLQSGFAWTESLVPLLVTCWVLAAAGVAARPTAARAAALAAVAGAMYLTHPRLVAVAAITWALLALMRRRRHLARPAAIGAGALLAAAVAGTHLLNRVIADRIYIPGYPGASSRDAIAALGTAEGWGNLGLAVAGQAWYLCVATAGLAPVGVAWLVMRARPALRSLRRGGEADPPAVASLAALALAGCAFAISCVWMADNFARPDKLVYGRYNEAFVAVLVALFVVAAVDVSDRHVRPFAETRNAGFPLRGLAGDLAGLGPISYDRSDSETQAADDLALFAYQWWFDANPLAFYRAEAGERPSTDLVMADARPPIAGARRVAGADPALWVLPGPGEEALVRRGVIPPR